MRLPLPFFFASLVLTAAVAPSPPVPAFARPDLLPPAVSRDGQVVAFGSTITPAGTVSDATDLYLYYTLSNGDFLRRVTSYSGNGFPLGVTAVSLTPDGKTAAFTAVPSGPGNAEEVRLVDTSTGKDRTLVVDKEGCIRPLLECPACFFTCLRTPHLTPDAGKVLYTAARERPFYVVNSDGSGLTRLPVYSGSLSPSPQRVSSRNGLVVFTSSAPNGPTFAASATDVYVMNLDGTDIRNLTKFGNDAFIYTRDAVISADGVTIVFESNYDPDSHGPGKVSRIFAVNSDGTGLRALSDSVGDSSSPSVSADGSRAVFLEGGQVYEVKTSGQGSKTRLTAFQQSVVLDPVISDDGSQVVFNIGPLSGGRGALYRVGTGGGDPKRVYAPRVLNPRGVAGVVSYEQPSAGSLMNLYGTNFGADSILVANSLPLPTALGGISVLVNGQPVPMLVVTPWQLTAQLPQTMTDGEAVFQIRTPDGTTTPGVTAEVRSVAPAVFGFTAPATEPEFAYWQAAAFHAGTRIAAGLAHPAKAGETLEIYGSGLGRTEPPVAAGVASPASPLARSLVVPKVLIGDRFATVTFAGLVPGLVGIYQVNAVVPEGLTPGLQPLAWIVGDFAGGPTGSIAIQ